MQIITSRKVREISGSRYIPFPKYWADAIGLLKDDEVKLELVDEHTIVIKIQEETRDK